MAFYSEEEDQQWKCLKHPSSNRRRHTGICPVCLRDRLINLCPNCANLQPCPCSCFTTTSSSSSNSSSSGLGIIGRVSNLIDNEPPFTRTRSTGIHFITSLLPPKENRQIISRILSVFRTNNKNKGDHDDEVARKEEELSNQDYYYSRPKETMMRRSTSLYNTATASKSTKVWHFPSPMKVFRHHKTSKVVQEH